MIETALMMTFLVTVLSGPAFESWRRRHDRPSARVAYLPTACCRGDR